MIRDVGEGVEPPAGIGSEPVAFVMPSRLPATCLLSGFKRFVVELTA